MGCASARTRRYWKFRNCFRHSSSEELHSCVRPSAHHSVRVYLRIASGCAFVDCHPLHLPIPSFSPPNTLLDLPTRPSPALPPPFLNISTHHPPSRSPAFSCPTTHPNSPPPAQQRMSSHFQHHPSDPFINAFIKARAPYHAPSPIIFLYIITQLSTHSLHSHTYPSDLPLLLPPATCRPSTERISDTKQRSR